MPYGPPGFVGTRGTSSLVALYTSVQAYFKATGRVAQVYLGLRYRDLWDTSRVVIIDGEFDGSNAPKVRSAGRFAAPTQKRSVNPREIVSWPRPVTLSIRGVDATDPDDESKQIEATEALIEATVQALQQATAIDPATGLAVGIGQASVDWGDSRAAWVDPGSATQQGWGKEFLVTFTYRCVFFDVADNIVFPTPAIQKNELSTTQSGTSASIASASASAGTAVVQGLGMCNPAQVGQNLVLSGATSAGNNGSFPIAFFLSPTSLVIANANAVAPDASNGAIAWSVQPPS